MTYFHSDYKITAKDKEPDYILDLSLGGSGGGCFRKGTFVRTHKGWTPIERIRKNDLVIAYDRDGKLSFGEVRNLLIHNKIETQDLYNFTIKINEELIVLPDITANHAIFDPATNEHKQAKEFIIGEFLSDIHGNLGEITNIQIVKAYTLPEDHIVYNLEVYPQHTFAVGNKNFWLKVHNGGGSKGAPRQAVEAPNTLQAEAIVKVLEVISEGEIDGIVGGFQGVFFNQVPVENIDGTRNFQNVFGDLRVGLPSQEYIKGFEEIESTFVSATLFTFTNPVTHNTIGTNIDAVKITIQLPEGLSKQDLSNGDLNGYTVSYKVVVYNLPSGTEETALEYTLEGKSITPYEIDHRIEKPSNNMGEAWAFRVERVSPDDSGANERSTTQLNRWTEIQTQNPPLTYDNTALVGISVPASEVGNQIPTRGYLVKGIKVQIPTNFDPILKTYSGNWDGTFTTAWTDDTAWILYDLITHDRYGVGSFLNRPVNANKWTFYNASQYNVALVPDGFGGYENRYTCNIVIQTRVSAWQLLQTIASNMRGILALNGREVILIQDRPEISSKLLTNANVLNGIFTYSTSKSTDRITAANVTFSDKNDRYLPRTISEESPTLINKYGYNPTDVVAYGVVTESAARRFAKWIIDTEEHQVELVSFQLALNAIDVNVGDIVTVLDNDYITDANAIFLSGRVLAVDATYTQITLDITAELSETGFTFEVANLAYDGFETRTIIEGTPTNIITLDTALPAGDYVGHEFICSKVGVIEPRQFRLLTSSEEEPGKITFTALFYDPDKYDRVELGLILEDHIYAYLAPVPPVTGLAIEEDNRNDDNLATNLIRLYWDFNAKHIRYEIAVRRNNGDFEVGYTNHTFKEWENILPGTYEVTVYAYDFLGRKSVGVTITYAYGLNDYSTLLPPINFQIVGGGAIFNSMSPSFEWDYNTANDSVTDMLQDYVAEIYSTDGLTLFNTYILPYNLDVSHYKGGLETYDRSSIYKDFGFYTRDFKIKLYSRDLLGKWSATSIDLDVTNPAPATPIGTISGFGRNVNFTLDPSVIIADLEDIIIAASGTSGFTPTEDTWYYKGLATKALNGTIIQAPAEGTYYIRVALSDNYSTEDLNWSSELSITVVDGSAVAVFEVPATPTNVVVTQKSTISQSGEVLNSVIITWDAPPQTVTGYTIGYRNFTLSETNYTYVSLTETHFEATNLPSGVSWRFILRADNGNAHSMWTVEDNVTTTGDTTDPGDPSGLTATNGYNTVTLNWINPTDLDFKETEIWFYSDNDRSFATRVAIAAGTSYVFPDLDPGLSGYFWIRSVDTSGNLSNFFPASPTNGVLASTQYIGTSDISPAIVADIVDGTTAYDETVLYRSTGTPTNTPDPANISIVENANGSRDITLSWNVYTQGTKQADQLILFYSEGTDAITVNDSAIVMNVNTASASYYTFTGVDQTKTYRAGIAAARRTENGLEIGPIIQPISNPDWRVIGLPTAILEGVSSTYLGQRCKIINNANGIVNLDLATYNIFVVTVTGNTEFTITDPGWKVSDGNEADMGTIVLFLVNSTGTPTPITWPGIIHWTDNGTPPTLTSTVGHVDSLVFYTIDNVGSLYGFKFGSDYI